MTDRTPAADLLRRCLAVAWTACAIAALGGVVRAAEGDAAEPAKAEEDAEKQRLLDRLPFDRLTLDAANQNAVIDTQILDIPNRRKFRPLPDSGSIKVRRLSQPSVPYEVSWSAIERVDLYEEMLLAEADRLSAAGDFDQAFEYLGFLFNNYPDLPGLEQSAETFLWQDASATFRASRLEDALASLLALYERNPRYARLAPAIDAVGDALVTARLQADDFAGARSVIDMLESSFPRLKLSVTGKWRGKFQSDAATALVEGRRALEAGEFAAARAAVQQARGIFPTIDGAAELLAAIQDAAPEIRIGVLQPQPALPGVDSLEWAAVRVNSLVDPKLVDMIAFGAEGGEYASPWARIENDDVGLVTTITVNDSAKRQGVTAAAVARRLVEMANPASPVFDEVYQALAKSVTAEGDSVHVAWRRPHIRPAALLQTPIRTLGPPFEAGLWYERDQDHSTAKLNRYERAAGTDATPGPRFVVEQGFSDDDAAVAALASGEIDVLDRVPPWQLERLNQAPGVRVERYRLPTVHVLLPNYANPLLEIREFRRALCYAIDREGIVRDLLLAGGEQLGYRAVSGPFLAGENATDPIGYAYQPGIEPRPYEPRLAAVLSAVARNGLAKREAAAKKAAEGEQSAEETASAEDGGEAPAADDKPADGDDANNDDAKKPDPPPPLRLAHAADPVARLACQTIKAQLDQVGIPVELVELTGDVNAGGDNAAPSWDLLYAELAVWEPIVDARRLLGPHGMAGQSSAYMNLALDRLEGAENWSQVIARAKELHGIAHFDLPVIPLWQTVNYCAYRTWLKNVGDEPVTLYQNLTEWEKTFAEGPPQ
ncbi:MAG: hypothetical protein KDA44_22510 [Planctomycetales bacterium]|nr:hypothetical protein [Planctomycetales bacterium]